MPQFDTFTFLSQLFWVFLLFSLLYLALAYYLLPAISIVLKVRRNKLSSSLSSSLVSTKTEAIILHLISNRFDQSSMAEKQIETKHIESFKSWRSNDIDSLQSYFTENYVVKNFIVSYSTKLTSLVLSGMAK